MIEYENNSDWQDVQERIAANERMQEKCEDLQNYLDNEWQALIIERARIETEIEKCD
tara:strand:- start:246 stop:416 length:171 start_codon:yes stop_codon:yes gene_type:complete